MGKEMGRERESVWEGKEEKRTSRLIKTTNKGKRERKRERWKRGPREMVSKTIVTL